MTKVQVAKQRTCVFNKFLRVESKCQKIPCSSTGLPGVALEPDGSYLGSRSYRPLHRGQDASLGSRKSPLPVHHGGRECRCALFFPRSRGDEPRRSDGSPAELQHFGRTEIPAVDSKAFLKATKRCESNRLPMLLSTFFLCYAKVTYPSEIKRRSRRSCR